MKKALITGITGQDGSYLAEFLINKGYKVHGIKRRTSLINTDRIDHLYQDPNESNRNFVLHHGDLTDSTSLIRIIQEVQPDEIYNLGAMSHVHVSFEAPVYTANADGIGTLRILEAIKLLGLTKKTGIKNPTMAADSLELLSDYETFKRLSGTIDLSKYNKDCTDYTTEYKAELREEYSWWWSQEETNKIEKITKLLDKINKEEHILRLSIGKDHNNLYNFSDSTYSIHLGDIERAKNRLRRRE